MRSRKSRASCFRNNIGIQSVPSLSHYIRGFAPTSLSVQFHSFDDANRTTVAYFSGNRVFCRDCVLWPWTTHDALHSAAQRGGHGTRELSSLTVESYKSTDIIALIFRAFCQVLGENSKR